MLATPVTMPNGTIPISGGACARTPAKNRLRGESTPRRYREPHGGD
jgi:hypothetical protein